MLSLGFICLVGLKEWRIICIMLRLGFICLVRLVWLSSELKNKGASCLKIRGELSGVNCPGGQVVQIHSHAIYIACNPMTTLQRADAKP